MLIDGREVPPGGVAVEGEPTRALWVGAVAAVFLLNEKSFSFFAARGSAPKNDRSALVAAGADVGCLAGTLELGPTSRLAVPLEGADSLAVVLVVLFEAGLPVAPLGPARGGTLAVPLLPGAMPPLPLGTRLLPNAVRFEASGKAGSADLRFLLASPSGFGEPSPVNFEVLAEFEGLRLRALAQRSLIAVARSRAAFVSH